MGAPPAVVTAQVNRDLMDEIGRLKKQRDDLQGQNTDLVEERRALQATLDTLRSRLRDVKPHRHDSAVFVCRVCQAGEW